MIRKFLLIILWGTISYTIFAQTPVALYSFDGCSLSDKTGAYADVVVSGNPACSCGPVNDGFGPAQTGDIMDFDARLGNLMSADFSMRFYIKILNKSGSGLVDIMSNASTCLQDSSFSIQFDQLSQTIIFNIVINPTNKIVVQSKLDPNKCWHDIAVTRDKVTFTLYVDGEEKDKFTYEKGLVIPVRSDNPFRVGMSVCNSQSFIGFIDELSFYGSALQINDIRAIYMPVNQILTPDTFLVRGDILVPRVRTGCTTGIQWTPASGISDPNIASPELSPEETTEYVLEFRETDCISTDTLRIQVIDPQDIRCEQLYLPNAFTPNGDEINDVFGISNFYIIDVLDYFDIFDKWGGMVFHTTNKNDKWDGNYGGKALNPGIYSYKISYSCNGKKYLKTGAFNILR